MRKIVDARGLSCPEPVLKLKRAFCDSGEIELLVDSQVCVENCSRFARAKGYKVTVSGESGQYAMSFEKETEK